MKIRPAEVADFPAIKAVARTTWNDTYDALEAELIDRTVDRWYTDDSMPLGAPGTVALVVEVDGSVVGFTHAVAQGETADILRMYVEPGCQGDGVGTDLHDCLVEQLEVYDVERIRAFDFAFNDTSRQFYESRGFEQTDTGEVEIDGEFYDEAVYSREL